MNALSSIRTANRLLGALAPGFTAGIARKLLMTPAPNRPRDRELDALKAAEPITFRFGLSALRWGDSAAPIVLMMHGWQGRATQFHAFVEPLLAAGRQVIALEAPAHGRSPGEQTSVVGFAEALLEAVSELRQVESVVGHSMGGSAALIALDRVRYADRAVVIGSPPAVSRVLDRFADTLALPAPAKHAFFDIVDQYTGVPARELDIARIGPHLGIPGLVVHDRDDDSIPFAEGRALAEAWPHARFVETRGLGHRRVLHDPQVVKAVTRFLLERPARGRRSAA